MSKYGRAQASGPLLTKGLGNGKLLGNFAIGGCYFRNRDLG